MPTPEAVVFDAYGTLLDVNAAMEGHAARLGERWPALAAEWRAKQLEYTWVRSLTGAAMHEDFWLCTRDALAVVLARHGIADEALAKGLMEAYRTLPAYPEVPGVLAAIRARGIPVAILSNGTPGMLEAAVKAAGIAGLVDEILSVEEVGVFKPDPRVYRLAMRQFGCEPEDLVFVSGNAWDAQAALAAEMRVVRVNRTGAPDEYGLAAAGVPDIADLSGLEALLA
ncbi:haloacid dehalogenase type II [Roseomonas alkaliterrae]|jgi:2-haloacid dehalogenase|uniref:(S)-2-haloacid dehalogenase n=1 Tax=Neoroseomonas alkaliterrae TaxID=1452450 RepID=A0A840XJI0_9PROT|nr:haloacid dehalogenase type II [Neoroseomonas alkaliterrae]MBB5688755.1 2-haloacid dehalogenase [Neoroseomonas alkaliterrae]MBR0675107.1 haloacid dehalogenase type II [Neoroseomonas alkaliterrae]